MVHPCCFPLHSQVLRVGSTNQSVRILKVLAHKCFLGFSYFHLLLSGRDRRMGRRPPRELYMKWGPGVRPAAQKRTVRPRLHWSLNVKAHVGVGW
jgi:hypothetical protein